MSETGDNNNTIIYRLDSMEKSLSLVLEKIEEMNKTLADSRVSDNQTKNDIEALEKRVSIIEQKQNEIKTELTEVKTAPAKASAKRWDYVADYIFKSLVAIVVGYIFLKVGLK